VRCRSGRVGIIRDRNIFSSFGTLAIARYGVGSSVLQVITIPVMGVAMAVATLVGQNIGAGNIERAARITWLGTVVSFATLTLLGGDCVAVRALPGQLFHPE
jgi:Na+-driven multidrug efflux pump